jgi:uncharacterized membrane protein
MAMKRLNTTLLCLVLSVLSLTFSLMFQRMAYWGQNGSLSMTWYWAGATLSYLFSISAVLILPKKNKKIVKPEFFLRILTLVIIIISLLLTTVIIIAWKSGF